MTISEERAGRVLRVHRDWLNGGFHQVLSNLSAVDEHGVAYVTAYAELGLPTVARLVEEALATWRRKAAETDPIWDDLDSRYERLTYGVKGDRPDTIEATVIRFIQDNPNEFGIALPLTGK